MRKRVFRLRIESTPAYTCFLIAHGVEFHAKPWTSYVDVTIDFEIDIQYWPHQEALVTKTGERSDA